MTITEIKEYSKKHDSKTAIISQAEEAYSIGEISFMLTEAAKIPKLHLLCQPELAKILQNDFESVQPSSKMDPKSWIEILLAGQLTDEQIFSLIDLAVEQAKTL